MDHKTRNISNTISFHDEKVFDELFQQYFPRLDAYALKFVEDSTLSKDIVQEAFIAIWVRKQHIQLDTFENYLFVSVRNICLNHLKN